MGNLIKIFAALSMLIAICGIGAFFAFIGKAKGAPQEAALSAMILCVVIPPYVIARSLELMGSKKGGVVIKSE